MAMFAPMLLMASRGWVARIMRSGRRAWAVDIAAYLAGGLVSIVFVAALLGKDGIGRNVAIYGGDEHGLEGTPFGVAQVAGGVARGLLRRFFRVALIVYRVWMLLLRRRRFVLEERDVPWLFLARRSLVCLCCRWSGMNTSRCSRLFSP